MNPNIIPSYRNPLLSVLDPGSFAVGTHETDWVSLSDFGWVMCVLSVGTLGASATVDAKIEQATDATGSGAKDVVSPVTMVPKAISQLTKADGEDDKQVIINVRGDDLDTNNGFTHVRLSVAVGVADSHLGACLLGFDARHEPAAGVASIAEIVS